jgi:hypothetical protein
MKAIMKYQTSERCPSAQSERLLPRLEAMNSGGDDARSGVESARHLDAGCVSRKIDPPQRDDAGGKVDDPKKALSVFGQHGGGGNVQN